MFSKISEIRRRFRRWFNHNPYINGTKGVISLFLALILTPFLSIALLLVESARYQSAYELMNELIDSAALSAEADYDDYLDDRFGLLSFSQENGGPSSTFSQYLSSNAKTMMGRSVTFNGVNAQGRFPLSDDEIFEEQILEFSKISVGVEAGTDFLHVDKWGEKLTDLLGTEDISNTIDATEKSAEAAKAISGVISDLQTLQKDMNDTYAPAKQKYLDAAGEFKSKTSDLVGKLGSAAGVSADESDAGDGTDAGDGSGEPADPYDNADVKSSIKAAEKARDDYRDAAKELDSAATTIKGDIKTVGHELDTVSEKIEKAGEAIKKMSEGKKKTNSGSTNTGTASDSNSASQSSSSGTDAEKETGLAAVKNSYEKITNGLDSLYDQTSYQRDIDQMVSDLRQQEKDLGNVVYTKAPAHPSSSKEYITENTDVNSDGFGSKYGAVPLDAIKDTTGERVGTFLGDVLSDVQIGDDDKNDLLKILDALDNLVNLHFLYDPALDSAVPASYDSTSLSSGLLVSSITKLTQSGRDLLGSVTNPLKVFFALGEFLLSVAEFLGGIVTWIGGTLVNLFRLTVNLPQIGKTFLCTAYGAYNCPNRTNYSSESGIAGYSYSKIFEMAGGSSSNNLSGSISDLASLANSGGGGDSCFKGAEAEYLLVGSSSELKNQVVCAYQILMLRMALNFITIRKDPQVAAMAAKANVAAFVVYAGYDILEAVLDTFILVNGGDVALVKKKVYASAAGLPDLLNSITDLTNMSGQSKNSVKDKIKEKYGEQKDENNSYTFNYSEYLAVFMLLTVDKSKYIDRLQNIVEMEGKTNYLDFQMDKTYTSVGADVDYNLNAMFTLDGLSGPFHVKRTRYAGY